MSTREAAEAILKKKGSISSMELADKLQISRVHAQRVIHQMVEEGLLIKQGVTRGTTYVTINAAKKTPRLHIKITLRNSNLHEEEILKRIESETDILEGVSDNVRRMFRHGFTEMLNNAIDHSRSKSIEVEARKTSTALVFTVRDHGIGAFNNIQRTFGLNSTIEAIQELLKGKSTTDPKRHAGEGIFFTSRMADVFSIDSFDKTLLINNLIDDIFIRNRRPLKGTRVTFTVQLTSDKDTASVFNAFTGTFDEDLAFNKTSATIKLYKYGKDLPSRSEAKRVVTNLEKFKEVELDFKDVDTIGQGFADEIFRVWQTQHPETALFATNANENVAFMVRRAGGTIGQEKLAL